MPITLEMARLVYVFGDAEEGVAFYCKRCNYPLAKVDAGGVLEPAAIEIIRHLNEPSC